MARSWANFLYGFEKTLAELKNTLVEYASSLDNICRILFVAIIVVSDPLSILI